MRKLKNNIRSTNPAVLFAEGVESLISDPLYSPSSHDQRDLGEMRRAAGKPDSRGNLFSVLLRQFARL